MRLPSEQALLFLRHVGWAKIGSLPASFRLGRKIHRQQPPMALAETHPVLHDAGDEVRLPNCLKGFDAARPLAARRFHHGIDLFLHAHRSMSVGQDRKRRCLVEYLDLGVLARANKDKIETDPTLDHWFAQVDPRLHLRNKRHPICIMPNNIARRELCLC